MNCIVCNNQSADSFQTSDTKTYWKCGYCFAKFLDPSLYIEVGIEKERYLEHDNRIDDEAYRSFLSRLANPLQKKLSVDDTGLDFGCGHGPALALKQQSIFIIPIRNLMLLIIYCRLAAGLG